MYQKSSSGEFLFVKWCDVLIDILCNLYLLVYNLENYLSRKLPRVGGGHQIKQPKKHRS